MPKTTSARSAGVRRDMMMAGFFRTWLLPYPESVGYKVLVGGEPIGGIIVWILPEGDHILGTIFIDPVYQDKGVGRRLWRFIESCYPESKSWRLATPTWAVKYNHFYQICGFSRVDEDPLIEAGTESLIFRKLLKEN